MTQTEQLLEKNNQLLQEVLNAVKGLRLQNSIGEVDTCHPDEALMILGLNNKRYLTYFHKIGLLKRRKGGSGYLYFKNECKALASKMAVNEIVVPKIKTIYG